MNAHLDYPLDEVMDMSEPAELPDAEEPEQDVPLGIEAEEPTIADDIKQDDETRDEEPSSIIEPEASDEDDDDDDDLDEDDDEDEDEDEDIDEDEEDEDVDELDTSRDSSVDIDLK